MISLDFKYVSNKNLRKILHEIEKQTKWRLKQEYGETISKRILKNFIDITLELDLTYQKVRQVLFERKIVEIDKELSRRNRFYPNRGVRENEIIKLIELEEKIKELRVQQSRLKCNFMYRDWLSAERLYPINIRGWRIRNDKDSKQ